MKQDRFTTPYLLSWVVVVLAAAASAGGLFIQGLYRDNSFVQLAWRGNDLVTLTVAVPVMAASLLLVRRGSQRARLVWMGTLWYMLYNYIFYLYAAAFNRFFLVYVGLFTLSGYAFFLSLMRLDVGRIGGSFGGRTPVRWISAFMAGFSLLLGVLWLGMSLSFLFTGRVPETVTQTGHPTAVVFATDLSLALPAMLLGAVLLWKRRPWGFVLSTIVAFKAATYGLALVVMSAATHLKSGVLDPLTPLWVVLTVGGLASWIVLLKHARPQTVDADLAG